MTKTNDSEPLGKTALTVAAEFIKYTVALGTGALVFSTGLVTENFSFTTVGKIFLILSWVALVVSIIAGVLAYSRIPVKLSNEDYSFEDKWLNYPGRFHQITFFVGIICLGITLALTLLE